MMFASGGVMTEQAFASVWGLSYSDFEFLTRFTLGYGGLEAS